MSGVRKSQLREADPNGPCTCGVEGPDSFGNYDLIEAADCPLHAPAPKEETCESTSTTSQ